MFEEVCYKWYCRTIWLGLSRVPVGLWLVDCGCWWDVTITDWWRGVWRHSIEWHHRHHLTSSSSLSFWEGSILWAPPPKKKGPFHPCCAARDSLQNPHAAEKRKRLDVVSMSFYDVKPSPPINDRCISFPSTIHQSQSGMKSRQTESYGPTVLLLHTSKGNSWKVKFDWKTTKVPWHSSFNMQGGIIEIRVHLISYISGLLFIVFSSFALQGV